MVQNTLEHTSLLEVMGCTIIVCLLGHDIITVRLNNYAVIIVRAILHLKIDVFLLRLKHTLFRIHAGSINIIADLIGVGRSKCHIYVFLSHSPHVNWIQHLYLLFYRRTTFCRGIA